MPMPIGRSLSFSFSSLCFTKPISFEYANILFNQGGSAEAKARLTDKFWKEITAMLSDCGLSINMKKASLYASTCSDDSLSILRSELPEALKFHTDGVVLVGTPIGNDEFCKHF
jgi:hypothetical protein